jgi:hypothetical protein
MNLPPAGQSANGVGTCWYKLTDLPTALLRLETLEEEGERLSSAIYSTTYSSIRREAYEFPTAHPEASTKLISSYDKSYTISALYPTCSPSMRQRHPFHHRRHSTTKPPSVLRYTLTLLKARPTPSDITTLSIYAEARNAPSPHDKWYFNTTLTSTSSSLQQRKTTDSPPPPYSA